MGRSSCTVAGLSGRSWTVGPEPSPKSPRPPARPMGRAAISAARNRRKSETPGFSSGPRDGASDLR
eukprot:15466822-Alexandrium_andersonii.AAC.1